MKIKLDEKRFLAAIDGEGDHEIGAGIVAADPEGREGMTITAEQIPDEVDDALIEALGKDSWRTKMAIADALNAWPKAFSNPVEGIGAHNRIVLPLPQKEPRT